MKKGVRREGRILKKEWGRGIKKGVGGGGEEINKE